MATTWPATHRLNIGSVLYRELFFAAVAQSRTMGPGSPPMFSLCRNDAGGVAVCGGSKDLRTMTMVMPVTPTFF